MIETISNTIQTYGFPIAMCLIEAWYIKYQHDENRNETERFTQALEANTLALTELKDNLISKSTK